MKNKIKKSQVLVKNGLKITIRGLVNEIQKKNLK